MNAETKHSGPVDVLAVMEGLADFLSFKCGPSESVEIVSEARAAVAELIEDRDQCSMRLAEALRGMLSIEDSVTQGQERERREEWLPKARAALAAFRSAS
jgi:hypothetical protein